MHRVFNETITHHLGSNATEQDFLAEDLTPDYDIYDMTMTLTLNTVTLR